MYSLIKLAGVICLAILGLLRIGRELIGPPPLPVRTDSEDEEP